MQLAFVCGNIESEQLQISKLAMPAVSFYLM
jgi:hypothetical protein